MSFRPDLGDKPYTYGPKVGRRELKSYLRQTFKSFNPTKEQWNSFYETVDEWVATSDGRHAQWKTAALYVIQKQTCGLSKEDINLAENLYAKD